MDMLVVTGEIEVAPDDAEAFARAAARAGELTRRHDDGCMLYEFYQSVERPGVFRVYEEWRDEEALRAHARAEHMDGFRQAISSLSILSRNITKHDGTNSRPLDAE